MIYWLGSTGIPNLGIVEGDDEELTCSLIEEEVGGLGTGGGALEPLLLLPLFILLRDVKCNPNGKVEHPIEWLLYPLG